MVIVQVYQEKELCESVQLYSEDGLEIPDSSTVTLGERLHNYWSGLLRQRALWVSSFILLRLSWNGIPLGRYRGEETLYHHCWGLLGQINLSISRSILKKWSSNIRPLHNGTGSIVVSNHVLEVYVFVCSLTSAYTTGSTLMVGLEIGLGRKYRYMFQIMVLKSRFLYVLWKEKHLSYWGDSND